MIRELLKPNSKKIIKMEIIQKLLYFCVKNTQNAATICCEEFIFF